MKMKKKVSMAIATTALGAVLVAGGVTAALFTSTTTNEGNTFTAGTVTIEDITDGAVFNATQFYANLAPGDHETALMTIQNDGTLDAWVKVNNFEGEGALFEGDYPLAIQISEDAVLVPAGQTAEFEVAYNFPIEAGNEYQGATGTLDIEVIAVQARNNTNDDATGPISWGN